MNTLIIVTSLVMIAWLVHDAQAWCERYDYRKHFED
jgi:hypothetical protein